MRIRKAIYFALATMVMAYSCTGLKEQEDPMIYSVTSLSVKPVDVTNESLELDFVAELECGSKVSGESSFIYSLNSNFTSSTTLATDEAFTAKTLLNAYGETYYVKAVFSNGRNKIESEAVSFQLLPFDEYVTLTAPEPKSISDNSASFVSIVSAAQGVSLDKYGFELSEGKEPFSPASSIESTSTNGEIAGEFKTLVPGGTYYVRSYASEGENTAYSNVVEFKTEAVLPTLALPKVSDILFDSANAESEVLSDGGDEISEQGFVFGLSQNPTLDNATKAISIDKGVGKFSIALQDLAPGKLYYIKSFATNSKGTAYSLETSFTTGVTLPTVTTTSISSITSSSAKSGGNVTADGGAAVTARGIVWGETASPTLESSKTSDGTGMGEFTSSMSGLKPGTKYYVRAYASNAAGTAYGNEQTFTTEIALPVVVTSSVTDITADSAKGGGSVTSDGGSEITAKGIVWSTSQNPTISLSTKTSEGTGTAAFVSSITGLNPGATYYVRAYATNAKGTAYGAQVSFKAGTLAPTISTSSVTGITSSSAICGGNVTKDGGAPVTARGVVWSQSHNPTVSLSTKTSNGTGTGTFTSSISGLEPGKTYYVRAYATNDAGTDYGEEKTFTTLIALPVVVTSTITDITSESAKGGGSITSDGGSEITAKGIVWSTSENPTISLSTKTNDGTGASSFVSSITGLTPGETYYVRAYATNSKGTAYGAQVSFSAGKAAPSVLTAAVSHFTSRSATCGGEVTFNGGSSVTSRGVVWSMSHNPTVSLSTKTVDGSGDGSFTSSMSGLEPGKTYYVRAYATNLYGTSYGEERTFTTDIEVPVVATASISEITSSSAKGGGSISFDGGSQITAKGVVWSTSQNPTISLSTKTNDGSGTSSFVSSISGLTPGVTYYVRAYATNAKGTAYGEQVSFKTGIVAPVLTTTEVSEITSRSVKVGGNISFDGGSPVTSRGVVWGTSHNPTTDMSTKISSGSGTGLFNATITNLLPGTKYYVRAYAVNQSGTSYGNEVEFTTDIELPVAETASISGITSTSAKGGGSISFDGGSAITAKGLVWGISGNPTISLTTKTNDGTGTSSYTSSITGLTPGTTYYVRAYATNGRGTAYGSQFSFTTDALAPEVSTIAMSEIDSRSAKTGGNIAFDGGADITSRGVVWSTEHNPTTDIQTKIISGSGDGAFDVTITGLVPNTHYYVRAFAINRVGTSYGNEVEFTTLKELPTVNLTGVSNIELSTATASGNLVSDGGDALLEKGFVWSTTEHPTIMSSKIVNTESSTEFSSFITGLKSNTEYFIRAYATNSLGTSYSEEQSFITGSDHESVDLGLSVKWATYNVGSNSPSRSGYFFKWAYAEPGGPYTESSYKYYSNGGVTKYYTSRDAVLDSIDDAATVNWGENWRVPTKEEFEELISNCDFVDCYINEIRGTKVVSRVSGYEGNYIFFPNTGYYEIDGHFVSPEILPGVSFWASTVDIRTYSGQLVKGSGTHAYYFQSFFNSQYTSESHSVYHFPRYFGLQIRAVCSKD